MMGPQIFPTFSYHFNSASIGTYFKYSPITQGLIPTFQSRELATGLQFTKIFSKTPIYLSFDYSNLTCSFEGGILEMNTKSYTFSAGGGF